MICTTRYLEKCREEAQTLQSIFCNSRPIKTHPPEVDPFFAWIQTVSMEAWDMGRDISCHEHTIGSKGNHSDKQRISYKKEGDRLLADSISQDGYTYTFLHAKHASVKELC